jgi:hypothetical protein
MTFLGVPVGIGHFVLVLEEDNDVFLIHDPIAGPLRRVSREVFLASWAYHEFGGVVLWKDQ